ncbi:hypothetical protein M9H77_09115 [Catharanthus roseus]|uniref:Uncharacterized protein n=1 Tax=Catharanthus roseus TaxID=4058 RepID=A0ACC0BZU4_CATRO|nr:hypothetical protein M9H77_09115 [Catharanthus roseus]
MDGTVGTIFIGLIEELQHFIQIDILLSLQLVDGCPLPPLQVQWDYHRDIGSYRDIIGIGNIPGILNPRELAGMAGTLVHDSVSKCEGASSHSASTKVFLKTYILLFGGRHAS